MVFGNTSPRASSPMNNKNNGMNPIVFNNEKNTQVMTQISAIYNKRSRSTQNQGAQQTQNNNADNQTSTGINNAGERGKSPVIQ